jgi:hypothetical protein
MDVCSSINLFDELRDDELSFAYAGSFSDSITHRIVELTQYNIDSRGSFSKLKNKISFLMVECYQNIVRHTDSKQDQPDPKNQANAFFVRSIGNVFFISSINYIDNEAIQNVKEKLDRVNSLSSDELRLLQKQVLAKGRLSEKGGAGLGIIEMARKSGQKIDYDFDRIDDHYSLFFLHLKLQLEDVNEGTHIQDVTIQTMKVLYSKLIASKILIMHKGDFSEQSVLPIIQMIENFKKHTELQVGKKRLFHISVEMLQNISQHAHKKNGINEAIFTLGKIDDSYIISTSNYVEKSKVDSLKNHLKELKGLSKSELDMLFKTKFRSLNEENVHGVGLGLVDISRKCHSFDYSFNHSGENPLFSLFVRV